MSEFQLFQDDDGQWRWRLIAHNGEIVATSEAYTRAADAARGAFDAAHAAEVASSHPSRRRGHRGETWPMLPTKRTAQKFLRDLAVALAVAILVFVSDNVADLGLSPEFTAILVAVVLAALRTIRGYVGREPPGG